MNDDFIRRQTAMDCLTGIFEYPVSLHDYITATLKKLQNAPSEDVQPVRHGRWSVFATSLIGNALMQCSECGKVAYDPYRYCPNCGARMDFEKGDKEK